MDYSLDEEQNDVRDLADGLIGRRTAFYDAAAPMDDTWLDENLWRELAVGGLLGIAVADVYGGSGAGFVEQCLVVESAARMGARVPLVDTVVNAALPVAAFGTEDQKARLLAPFCAGDAILTAAGSSRLGALPTITATPSGDAWLLNGAVDHVILADRAARVLVPAATGDGAVGWFLLDPGAEGVSASAQTAVDRVRRYRVEATQVVVGAADVLAEPGPDGAEVSAWIDRHGVAARCVSLAASAEAALRMTATHVTDRHQFGVPVGTFQAVAHRVADAYIDVTAIRLTAWRAAWLVAGEQPAEESLAIAAWWATDAANRVADAAMHLHGGQSVDLDYPLHRYFLAVRQGELALGGPGPRLLALGTAMAVA